MTRPSVRAWNILRVRTLELIGWEGLAGISLLALALLIFSNEARTAHAFAQNVERVTTSDATQDIFPDDALKAAIPSPTSSPAYRGDVAVLISQMEMIAIENGLGWSAADYRILPGTDTSSSSLEVRSRFKGEYPKLRRMLSRILGDVPSAVLRELSLSRANSETAEIDAKLTIAVVLQEEPADVSPIRPKGTK